MQRRYTGQPNGEYFSVHTDTVTVAWSLHIPINGLLHPWIACRYLRTVINLKCTSMKDGSRLVDDELETVHAAGLDFRNRRWSGSVYVLQMFFSVFFCFFLLFPSVKNMRQPFSGTAERILMKLLPNDSGENVVCIAVPKWGLGPRLIFFWGGG